MSGAGEFCDAITREIARVLDVDDMEGNKKERLATWQTSWRVFMDFKRLDAAQTMALKATFATRGGVVTSIDLGGNALCSLDPQETIDSDVIHARMVVGKLFVEHNNLHPEKRFAIVHAGYTDALCEVASATDILFVVCGTNQHRYFLVHGVVSERVLVVYDSSLRSWTTSKAIDALRTRLVRALERASLSMGNRPKWRLVFAKPHKDTEVPTKLADYIDPKYVAQQLEGVHSRHSGVLVCAVAESIMCGWNHKHSHMRHIDPICFRFHMLWCFWFIAAHGKLPAELSKSIRYA